MSVECIMDIECCTWRLFTVSLFTVIIQKVYTNLKLYHLLTKTSLKAMLKTLFEPKTLNMFQRQRTTSSGTKYHNITHLERIFKIIK